MAFKFRFRFRAANSFLLNSSPILVPRDAAEDRREELRKELETSLTAGSMD